MIKLTVEQFLMAIVKYYGEYENPHVKKEVAKYVSSNYTPSELYRLWKKTQLGYSTKWRVTPDIAIFEEINKKHGIISFINGTRVISECDTKKTLEPPEEVEDFSADIDLLMQGFKAKVIRDKKAKE